MSEYDEIRKRAATGNEARERITSGVYLRPRQESQPSQFDAIRNRSAAPSPQSFNESVASGNVTGPNLMTLEQTSRIQAAKKFAAENPQPDPPSLKDAVGKVIKAYGNLGPIQFLKRTSAAAQTTIAPRGPMFKKGGGYDLEAPTPYERAKAQQEQVGTGGASDKVADFIGSAAGPFIPIGGVGVTKLYNNPLTQRAVGVVASKTGNDLGGRVAQEAAREAIVGVPIAAQHSLATGDGDIADVAKDAAIGAGIGAAFGAGVPLIGAGAKSALSKLEGTAIGKAFERFKERNKKTGSAIEQYIDNYKGEEVPAVEPIPATSAEVPKLPVFRPSRLKVEGDHNLIIDKVMREVIPVVTERQTPPLENPNELAKWVHRNFGDKSLSLNKVRELPYEDLRSLAEDIRAGMNVEQMVVQAAKERGYNLPNLFNKVTPSVFKRIEQDAQKRVYGVYPEKLPPIKRQIENVDSMVDDTIDYPFENVPPKQMEDAASIPSAERDFEPIRSEPETAVDPEDLFLPHDDVRIRDKIVDYFDEQEQAARERIKASRNTLYSTPIEPLTNYAIIGASKLVKGTVKFVDWSEAMIKEFGEGIKPHLKELFKLSKKEAKEAERRAAGVAHLPGVNQGIDPLAGNADDIARLTKALENSPAWKDKNRFLLNRETAERNFEDIMGEDASIMKKTYIEPVQKSAADRQRWISKEREDIKDLGIKYKSADDALVQEYGEGLITLDQLKEKSPQNWQKIEKAAETMRSKYDKYLDTANEILARNGYPEIPKRKNYFPHYEEIDTWLHKLGFGFEDNTLPADLSGLTANLKPGKNFFGHFLQRKGEETTLGALAGHDRYIEGISKVIFQTDNIKRLRGLDKALREKSEGSTHLSDFLANMTDYINILAGKKTELDRSLEAGIGRNLYSAVDWMKRRVGGNMIGGSISAAITNSIPVTQLAAQTNKASLVKGLTSTLQNINGNDGLSEASNFLVRRFPSEKLAMGKLDKAQNIAGSLFKFIDQFTSNLVIRSKYFENLDVKGMTPEEAMKSADQFATRMMADRSEGSMPTLFHSRTFGLITQFQLEVNNQLSHLFKDMPKSMSKTKYASAIAQVFLYSYLYNELYEKITGNRPAFDPIGVAVNAYEDFSNQRLTAGKAKENLVKNISGNLPFASVATGGRIPISSAMPNVLGVFSGKADLGDELIKPVKYLALPFGGSQINKTISGVTNLGYNPLYSDESGSYQEDNQGNDVLRYPIERDAANTIRGLLFGKNAFPEAQKYYGDNSRALSVKETKRVERSDNPEQTYNMILKERDVDRIKRQIDETKKDTELSRTDRLAKIQLLQERLRETRDMK